MKIWLDTEFNGWSGDLISIALVPEYGMPFYEVLPCDLPQKWVVENVLPNLRKAPITKSHLQHLLNQFIN
ncbi:MAG TPA: hypothetical protein VFM18_20740, partial [Methanosarcina sp.]|nr:hypothetical protein [Methanosarcina sp.]